MLNDKVQSIFGILPCLTGTYSLVSHVGFYFLVPDFNVVKNRRLGTFG